MQLILAPENTYGRKPLAATLHSQMQKNPRALKTMAHQSLQLAAYYLLQLQKMANCGHIIKEMAPCYGRQIFLLPDLQRLLYMNLMVKNILLSPVVEVR